MKRKEKIITLKKFDDFKNMVDTFGLTVMYKVEGDILNLYLDYQNIYHVRMQLLEPENLDVFLEDNFEAFVELEDIENGR